ncbi:Uncharacterized protein Adt_14014 [Abeliophyllum distichum]|uniref:DUF4283 domain-containing protein n=1 Tax=Abeliophyllum distichum TaxID=126358 RepID=A0ABD1TYF9_9LAMI
MGCPMRILKWTCDFYPDVETPIAPVWISFPLLPVHLRAKEFLFALSKIVGVPLRIDEATTDLLKRSEAGVCVEAPKPAVALAPKPVDVQGPIIDRTGKGKDKEK